jgi:ketosteroid isomerase-like protein
MPFTFLTHPKPHMMTNVDVVKQAYAHFATGNVGGVLALFDPAIEWRECKGIPFVKDDAWLGITRA